MNKILLLTGAHWRKNKGTSIGLVLLMILASMMICISLLLFTDAYPTASRESDRLNSGDGCCRLTGDIDAIDDAFIDEVFGNDSDNVYYYPTLYNMGSVPFGTGSLIISCQFGGADMWERPIGRTEIVTEDTSITSDYIYLPYQFYTSGGFNTGDTFDFEYHGTKLSLKVRGFLTTGYFGCNNSGVFEFVVDDDTLNELRGIAGADATAVVVIYDLKDGVRPSRFMIKASNKIAEVNGSVVVDGYSLRDDAIMNRTFMSLIIAVSILVVTVVILTVILLMLTNSITNYTRENMKTLGALKAIGYTSSDIKKSILVLFVILSVIGSAIGVAAAYSLIPLFAKFAVGQMGIPYTPSFSIISVCCAVFAVLFFTVIVTLISIRKIRNIEPIVALRDGIESHNFRKNHFRLDKGSRGLNRSLALKTMMFNKKQNIITFFVTGLVIFLCVVSLLMYENFDRNPKLDVLTWDICGGMLTTDVETGDEIMSWLSDRSDASNARAFRTSGIYYKDEDSLNAYVYEDLSKINNQHVCYKGRMPQYDNEIAIGGRFAKAYGYKVGEEIEMNYGGKSYSYLITGLLQITNNGGNIVFMTDEASEHIISWDGIPVQIAFDCADSDASDVIIEDLKSEFGDSLYSTTNFYEAIEGSLVTFRSLSKLMLIMVCSISAAVILLVLFLLIKALIYNKRRDYGIYKALGYTSRDLILQTAISFMPSIILASIVFSIVSYFTANPYMNIAMGSFGIIEADFDIPVVGVVIIGCCTVVLSFLFAVFEARKIRKIEAYDMLVGE